MRTRLNIQMTRARNQVGGAIYNTILFKEDGIDLIVGHPYSGQCMESLNYVERKNMVLISGSSTSPLLSLQDDRLFRTCLPDSAQAPALAEMWETWGAEAVLIFQVGQPWGDSLSDALKVEFLKRDIDVLTHIKYQPDEWNFTRKLDQANQTIAEWLEENDIETVGIQFISFNELSEIQQQAADYPNLIDIVWMTTDTGNADQILEQAGEWATKTRHFRPVMARDENPLYQEFEEKYIDLTGEMPGYYTATQYDAYWLLVETIIITGSTDADMIAANLIDISQTYYGLSGLLALDENGDRLTQLYDIKGFYEDEPGEYKEGTFGSYDGNTGVVSWNDPFLEETGIIRPGSKP